MAAHHKFGKRSLECLAEMEPKLAEVFKLALKYSKYDFGITQALRTLEEQEENVKSGNSKTMKSRHLPNEKGLSEAGDILIYVNGKGTYKANYYRKVAAAFFRAAIELGTPIEWGGHWESIFDGPHYQLAGGFQ